MKQFGWGWKITIIWSAIGATGFIVSLVHAWVTH